MDFGRNLKNLRKEAKLTQQQLATRLGVTKSVISFYERRERTPSPEILAKLARIFHVSSDYLLGLNRDETIDVSGLTDEDVAMIREIVRFLKKKNNR